MSLIINMVVGVVVGLVINYLSDVLPVFRRFTRPVCPSCGQPFSLSNYLSFNKCSHCGTKRSNRSFIVLITAIVISILLYFFPFSGLSFWATIPILTFLGVIVVIDIEHRAVLLETSFFGFVLFLIYGIILHGLVKTIMGGLVGFLITILFYGLGIAYVKIAGKLRHQAIDEVAFGFGDVFAGTFLGLLLGWSSVFGAIIIAIFTFGAYSLIYIVSLLISKRYNAFASALPFTPFLVLGTIVIFYL